MDEEPTSHSYASQRLRLNYVDWGNEQAPPLVMIHGARDHARNWDWVAQELREDFHVMAVDLRGHGESQWTNSGAYGLDEFIYDIAQLIHEKNLAPLYLMGHSLGGIIALRYAGILPENVTKVVAIEGLGRPPPRSAERVSGPIHQRYRTWLEKMRDLAERPYVNQPSLEAAIARMQEANTHLTPEQARHLTIHGVKRNEDGTYRWKFDNYIYSRLIAPQRVNAEISRQIWARITCPALLVRGVDSWTPDPEEGGDAACFQNARFVTIRNAGHWVHHDQLDEFLSLTKAFLKE